MLAGLVGRDKKQAERLARKYKAHAFYGANEYSACLANPEIAAVYVATPPGEHAKLAIRAADAGKHVLCEKPLAARLEQSAQMVEACRRNGASDDGVPQAFRAELSFFETTRSEWRSRSNRRDPHRIQ